MADDVIPTNSSKLSTKERHAQLGATLARAIEEGKTDVPENPEPLVCKPQKLESWRVFKIMAEFVDGFEAIRRYGLAITFFGTARDTLPENVYTDATALSGRLAKAGYAVITGGSSGLMEAANRGAYEAGGASIGLNIRLPHEQAGNKYVTESTTFDHFFVRKVMLAFASEVYICFPGGFGTIDEFSEILTLIQTKKIKRVPIVLYSKEYWTPIVNLFRDHLLMKYHAIDAEDMELFHIVDSVDEAYEYITKNVSC
ncbi:MAG: TIGR00730 family Rossman fold protein [Patescibacteria group bacterium]